MDNNEKCYEVDIDTELINKDFDDVDLYAEKMNDDETESDIQFE
jgi:hypothetical protein